MPVAALSVHLLSDIQILTKQSGDSLFPEVNLFTAYSFLLYNIYSISLLS